MHQLLSPLPLLHERCRIRGKPMKTIYRILGKRGRITIPFAFRQHVGFQPDDVLSFTIQEDQTVVIKREKLCNNNCMPDPEPEESAGVTLLDFLDSLTPEQQQAAVLHLSTKWAERNGIIPFRRAG